MGRMHNPPHPGALLRQSKQEMAQRFPENYGRHQAKG